MKAFNDLNLQDLHWVEGNAWLSRQELRDADDEVIATMQKSSWWKSTYEVDAPGNRWIFEPKGWFNRRIEIYSAGTDDLVTSFEYTGMSGAGKLTMPDARVYTWKKMGFWNDRWAWLEGDTSDENPVMGFDAGGFFRAKADLTFNENADFPALLVFLGWYLHTVLRQQRAATAASVVVVSS